MKTWMKWAAVFAAVVGAYFLGTYSSNTQSEMSYMMILMEDENFQPGEPMAMFTEYQDWMYAAREKGVEISGQELKDEATLIQSDNIIDNPNIGNQKVTGYFVFNANSKEEAIKIVQLNPHIKYGGSIQLKEYMKR